MTGSDEYDDNCGSLAWGSLVLKVLVALGLGCVSVGGMTVQVSRAKLS